MRFADYEKIVVNKATELLKDESWFHGVCMDTIKTNFDANRSIEEAVKAAVDDTTFWDEYWKPTKEVW